MNMVRLVRLVMRRPSSDFIQVPSMLYPHIEMSQEDFMKNYACSARELLVSFDSDGVSNPQPITTYTLPEIVQTENGNEDIWPGCYIIARKQLGQ